MKTTFSKNTSYIERNVDMKLITKALLLLIAGVFLFTGCSIKKTSVSEKSDANAESENQSFGKIGVALDVADSAYYWKFTSDDFEDFGMFYSMVPQSENSAVQLVEYKNGIEKVLAETETAGKIVVTDKKIYYNDNGVIMGINRDASGKEAIIDGYICAVSEDGKYIFYYPENPRLTAHNDIYSLSLETYESVLLANSSTLVGIRGETVFYTPDYVYSENAAEMSFFLCSSSPDGKDKCVIYESDTRYSSYFPKVAHIRFTDEYVYFSYGSVAGSAAVYQGGYTVRVKFDGTDAEILSENIGNAISTPMFEVNADGSITNRFVREIDEAYFTFRETHYKDQNGNLVWFDNVSGAPTEICPCFTDESYDISTPDEVLVNVTDKYAFFITHHGFYDSENCIGWRDAYTREKSVFYMVDRETKEVVTSYEF